MENNLNIALKNVGDMALKRRARRIVEELNLQDGDKVLEVGCGNGYYLSLLNRIGKKVDLVGIDHDRLALKDAIKYIGNNKVKLIYSKAENLPFESSVFDKVVMSEVIEHVNDEEKTLKEIKRVLKKGGILVLTTCNIEYPFLWDPINWVLQHFFNTHIESGFWAGIWNQHTRLYKEKTVQKLVNKAGLEVEVLESLTFWCLPFNHYIVNFIARLFYSHKLPRALATGMNKFKNNQQSFLIVLGFWLINLLDSLNDLLPQETGVSIFLKARRRF
ncbi:MAG: class I SAM-dependent methyltransferase [Candidatus Daviesbacteria bacterium]|nr:class I SAM-dependent methyltransferase [Candidatus Daviesbacteria bacterium]